MFSDRFLFQILLGQCESFVFLDGLEASSEDLQLTFPPDFTFLSVIAELHNLIVIAAKRPGANLSWRDGKLNFKGKLSQLSFFERKIAHLKFPINHPIYLAAHDKIVDN